MNDLATAMSFGNPGFSEEDFLAKVAEKIQTPLGLTEVTTYIHCLNKDRLREGCPLSLFEMRVVQLVLAKHLGSSFGDSTPLPI